MEKYAAARSVSIYVIDREGRKSLGNTQMYGCGTLAGCPQECDDLEVRHTRMGRWV